MERASGVVLYGLQYGYCYLGTTLEARSIRLTIFHYADKLKFTVAWV